MLSLDAEAAEWRCERWRDHLETVSNTEVDRLHQQILSEVSRFDGTEGPPAEPSREYSILMALYNTTAYVHDMHQLGMRGNG